MRLTLLLICFLSLQSTSATAQQIRVPAPSGQWVMDTAQMLSETERRSLEQKLSGYADSTSSQIIIVTVPDLGGAAASEYATELGRQWQVGQQEYDNGLVILVSRDDREVFIATGYGLEGAVPDALAGRIVRNVIVPNFRQGRYYAGLSEAVNIIIAAAAGEYEALPSHGPDQAPGVDAATIFVFLIIVFFILNGISSGRRGGGGRGGGRRYRHGWGGPPIIIWGGGGGRSGGFGGGGFGGGGFGGFGGGGGSFGGGGAGGSW